MSKKPYVTTGLILMITGACASESGPLFSTLEDSITNAPGIDVSAAQGSINWTQVKNAGTQFAFIKSGGMGTSGSTYTDGSFPANWPQARAASVIRGAYYYFQPVFDGVTQANSYINQVNAAGGRQVGDLPPAIDIELNVQNGVTYTLWDPVMANNIAHLQQWLTTVQNAYGVKPAIYTNKSTWDFMGSPQQFSGYPLWVANTERSSPLMPVGGWSTWTFWQYHVEQGPLGSIAGMPQATGLDHDYYTGSCDNSVAVGGTACARQGDSVQYRCLFGSTPGASLWASESCGSGSCSGSSCSTGGGGGACSCSGGTTFWHTAVPASDTSCGFRVCGLDNQLYSCQSGGWLPAGVSSCNCRCTNGADSQGHAINPDYTYCGYSVCGGDHQHYTCTAGGWSAQHDTCQ